MTKNLARVDLVLAGYRERVDLEPEEVARLTALARARPVTLAQIRAELALAAVTLIRNSRLSVMPLSPGEFEKIVAMGS